MAAVEQRISYRREALVGDIIVVRSAVLEVRPKSVRFVHEMFRGDGGDHLATMMVIGVHIDIVARKSTQFEPQIFAPTQAMLDPQPPAGTNGRPRPYLA